MIVKNYYCPRCKSAPGQPCRDAGKATTTNHSERTVTAHASSNLQKRTDEANEARELDARVADALSVVRGQLAFASASGITQQGLAALLVGTRRLFDAVELLAAKP